MSEWITAIIIILSSLILGIGVKFIATKIENKKFIDMMDWTKEDFKNFKKRIKNKKQKINKK